MNSFYASVELLDHPELVSLPVAVCGDPSGRHGIILAKNEPAKKYGVLTAETIWQAKHKCQDLILLRAHHEKYNQFFKRINAIYYKYTDLVEPFSIDESWLDVSGSLKLFGSGEEIAYQIKESIKNELGLTQSIGVSFNKIFAKMGSEYKKPDAVTVISRANYQKLLWPLPVREFFGVGSATAKKMNALGIQTIGDLANSDSGMLSSVFGKQGETLHTCANGLEDTPVRLAEESRKIKSVGNGITFRRDIAGEKDIRTALTSLSDTVAGRLRKYGLKCGGIKVDIKDPDFKTISRQAQLSHPTWLAGDIREAAYGIILNNWDIEKPIRLITVTGIHIGGEEEMPLQLSFLDGGICENSESGTDFSANAGQRGERLERTMDEIREKYGRRSIRYGGAIGNDIGIDMDEHREEDINAD